MISMLDTQVIFRIDKGLLNELDHRIHISGYKTRNEWFRAEVREYVKEVDKKKMLKKLDRLTIADITEDDIVQMVKDWRKGKGSN